MLSIVIPTYNEEKLLPCLLKSLKEQTFKDFEIIVADNHSVDDTRLIASKFGAKVVDGGMPAVGRNNGARFARGEWLLFLDADVILPPNFLEKAIKEIEKKKFCVATCLMKPLSDKKIDKVLHKTANLYLEATQKFFPRALGFCIFAKKETHQKLNGFNEKLKLAEDHDYVTRASKIGRFGIVKSVLIPVSVRRFDRDGRLNLSVKYMAVEAHLFFLGPIYSDVFKYKFGYPTKKGKKL
jgi:glycosyltransferase involved in cell wall biosynthesis